MAQPNVDGDLPEQFWSTQDGVAVLTAGRVTAWNAPAERIFGVPAATATAEEFDLPAVLGVTRSRLDALPTAGSGILEPPGCGPLRITAWRNDARDEMVLVFTDVSRSQRTERGLRELNAFAGQLLREQPPLDELLGILAASARSIASCDVAAAVLFLPRSLGVTHVAASTDPNDPTDHVPFVSASLAEPLLIGRSYAAESPHDDAVTGLADAPDTVDLREGAHLADDTELGPFLAVPIRNVGETVGAVIVGNRAHRRAFDGTDSSLLRDLASHAASAIAATANAALASESEERRREAIAAARHDIASPIATGRGYVQILQRRYDDMTPEQRARALSALAASFERLEDYSHRLLFDERLEVSAPTLRWSLLPVETFLDGVARDHDASLHAREITVRATRLEACPPTVAADPALLREVLDNLLSNAAKFTERGGEINLLARRQQDFVRIEVVDSGCGIPLEEQATVFERHTRTRQSRRDAVPGMGLGLSIVRRIVQAHGGNVGLHSRPGKGTMVWVTFPTTRPDETVDVTDHEHSSAG